MLRSDDAARCGIAVVTDGDATGQAGDRAGLLAEVVADQAHVALGAETALIASVVVVGDDAAGFLSAMLEGVEAEGGEDGGVVAAEDAEHAALVAHAILAAGAEVVVEVVRSLRGVEGVRASQDCLLGATTGR